MTKAQTITSAAPAGAASMMRWWVIGIPLLVANTIAQMDKMGMNIIIANKQFLKDMSLVGRPALAGSLVSSFLLSYAVFHFFWSWYVKKYGARSSAIIGITVWGLSLALSGIVATAGEMIVARIILGVSEAVLYPMAAAFVANWFPVKERGRATAVWLAGNHTGGILIGAFVVSIFAMGGWRVVFYALGALNLLIPLPMAIFLMRNRPRELKWIKENEVRTIEEGILAKTKEVPKGESKTYLSNYRFWMITLVGGFNHLYYWGWSTWMPTYFQNVRHFSFKSAGYLYSLNWVVALVAALLIGYLSDKVMRRAPFGGCSYFLGGLLIFIGGVIVPNPYWAVVTVIIGGCLQGIGYLMQQALFHSIVPESSMGSALGIAGGLGQLMACASPTLLGFLLGVYGFGAVVTFCALSLLVAGTLVLILAKQGY